MRSAKMCLSSNFVIFCGKIKLRVGCPLLHVSVPELGPTKLETDARRLCWTITRHQTLTALMKVTRAPFQCALTIWILALNILSLSWPLPHTNNYDGLIDSR